MRSTKGYLRQAMICIKQHSTGTVIRASYPQALELVNNGHWSFTSKGAWKRSGRVYYEG